MAKSNLQPKQALATGKLPEASGKLESAMSNIAQALERLSAPKSNYSRLQTFLPWIQLITCIFVVFASLFILSSTRGTRKELATLQSAEIAKAAKDIVNTAAEIKMVPERSVELKRQIDELTDIPSKINDVRPKVEYELGLIKAGLKNLQDSKSALINQESELEKVGASILATSSKIKLSVESSVQNYLFWTSPNDTRKVRVATVAASEPFRKSLLMLLPASERYPPKPKGADWDVTQGYILNNRFHDLLGSFPNMPSKGSATLDAYEFEKEFRYVLIVESSPNLQPPPNASKSFQADVILVVNDARGIDSESSSLEHFKTLKNWSTFCRERHGLAHLAICQIEGEQPNEQTKLMMNSLIIKIASPQWSMLQLTNRD